MNGYATSSPALRILYLEDDASVVARFVAIVDSSCSVFQARQVKHALDWLADGNAVDVMIANECNGGFELIERVRTNGSYRNVPFLLTCRHLSQNVLQEARRVGIADVVTDETNLGDLAIKLGSVRQLTAGQSSEQVTFRRFQTPWWKRLIDISVSLTALLLLSPLLLLTSLLIRFDSRGPVIYRSKRIGSNFRVFNMYKFRTMKPAADQMIASMASQNIYAQPTPAEPGESSKQPDNLCADCQQTGSVCRRMLFDHDQPVCEQQYLRKKKAPAKFMKFRNDPRITRLGVFLRNSSIDELPQLFNILIGDMSLVGNRPLPLYEAETLTTDEYVKRFGGPAGLTGLWQVKKRAKGQGPMSDRERIMLDIEYTDTFSFRTDMQIIFQTFFALWQKENV